MSLTPYEELLGEVVVGKEGPVAVKSFSNRVLGLYFSAHWCPPCRSFTPVLAEFYKAHPDDFEVVFVSNDQDDAGFQGYFRTMPWLALPFDDEEQRDALSRRFQVKGIPALVILDPTGAVITVKGREKVDGQPGAFPWK